jgi:hypothetical protein
MRKIHVCAKTAFVERPSTENRRISSFHMPCPSIIILENTLNLCTEKYGYGVFNHQHNVSVSHFLALLGVGNFTKVIRLCANCLQSNSQLLKV